MVPNCTKVSKLVSNELQWFKLVHQCNNDWMSFVVCSASLFQTILLACRWPVCARCWNRAGVWTGWLGELSWSYHYVEYLLPAMCQSPVVGLLFGHNFMSDLEKWFWTDLVLVSWYREHFEFRYFQFWTLVSRGSQSVSIIRNYPN